MNRNVVDPGMGQATQQPEAVACEICGSWEFECRDDGEYYCNSCSLPLLKGQSPRNELAADEG